MKQEERRPSAVTNKNIALRTSAQSRRFTRMSSFERPPRKLSKLLQAYNNESIIRQAVDRYLELVFRSGFDITSKSQRNLRLINDFFASFAESSGMTMQKLLVNTSFDLILYCNAFIVKARAKRRRRKTTNGDEVLLQNGPVEGYFSMDPTTVEIKADAFGNIQEYKQTTSGGATMRFSPLDVIHFAHYRPSGHLWGIPWIYPMIDDIVALREAEEDALRKLHMWSDPLMDITVGFEGAAGQPDEIAAVKEEVQDMSVNGGIVHSERAQIKVHSTEPVDTSKDVQYFFERVILGTGLSPLEFGKTEGASRSLGETQSSRTRDRINSIHRVVEDTVNIQMIAELVKDATGDSYSDGIDNEVYLHFREIHTDELRAQQNHITYLFEHNVLEEGETRDKLGLPPIKNRKELYINTVSIPLIEAEAAAKAKAAIAGSKATDNKNQPANQHGKKASATPTKAKASRDDPTDAMANTMTEWISTSFDVFKEKFKSDLTGEKTEVDIDGLVKQIHKDSASFVSEDSLKDAGFDKIIRELAKIANGLTEYSAKTASEKVKELVNDGEEKKKALLEEAEDREKEEIEKEFDEATKQGVKNLLNIMESSIIGAKTSVGSIKEKIHDLCKKVLKSPK